MGYPYPNFCLCAFLGPYFHPTSRTLNLTSHVKEKQYARIPPTPDPEPTPFHATVVKLSKAPKATENPKAPHFKRLNLLGT